MNRAVVCSVITASVVMFANAAPLDINLTSDEQILTGEDTIELGETLFVGGESETDVGKLIISNAADVVWNEQSFTVGANSSAGKGLGWIVVTNSTLRSTCDSEQFVSDANSEVGRGNLWIGRHSRGILEVEDGAVISNKLYVGGGGPGASVGKGVGAIYQRGGTVYPVCTNTPWKSSALGLSLNGTGFWQLENGEVTYSPDNGITRAFHIGSYGRGLFIQLGGTLNLMPKDYIAIGAMNYGRGHYCLLKGTTESQYVSLCAGGKGTAVSDINNKKINLYITSYLTVDGEDSRLAVEYVNACTALNTMQESHVNINNGGTLELSYFYSKYNYTGYTNSLRQNVSLPLNVNFNGGVIRPRNGEIDIFAYNTIQRCSRVAVYEKGIIVDCDNTDGLSYRVPIEAAGAGGISSIVLTDPVEGCIAPHIIIDGDGFGASAIPCFDTNTRIITNVYLTCRGWGYTRENTRVVLFDGETEKGEIAFEIADNETGGFTKTGPKVFSIGNTNSWRKTTSVLEGTLKVRCDWAIPSNTVLTLNTGATLDLNNKEITFCGLNGTGGIVENGALKLIGEWVIDAVKLAADGDSGEFDADIEINDLKVSISDETLLGADTWKYVLFSVAENRSITGIPQSVGMKGWRIEMNDRSCNLVKFRGTVFTLR